MDSIAFPVLSNNGRYRPVAICRLSAPWKMSCDNGGFRLFATSHRKKKGEDRGCRTSADPSAFWQSFLFSSSLSGTKPRLLNGRWPSASFFRLRLRVCSRNRGRFFFAMPGEERIVNFLTVYTLVHRGIGKGGFRFRFPFASGNKGVDRSDRAPPRIITYVYNLFHVLRKWWRVSWVLADLILRSSLRTCVREYSFSNFYAKRFTCGQLQQCTYVRTGLIFSRIVFFFSLSLFNRECWTQDFK